MTCFNQLIFLTVKQMIKFFLPLQITDIGLAALTEFNQGLEVLVLNYCNKITDVGVIDVISNLPRVNRLELHVSKLNLHL